MTSNSARRVKTPRQRAEEAVAVLERRHDRLSAKKKTAQDAADAFDPLIREVEAELKHVRDHPALKTTSSTDTTTED